MAVSAVLKRFDRYFYKSVVPGGTVTAVDDGVLAFYPQGATLIDAVSLAQNETSTPLHVYHPGAFNTTASFVNLGKAYLLDGTDSRAIELSFNSDGTVLIKNVGAGPTFPFQAGCRLLNTGTPLLAYRGPLGTSPITVSTDNFGRAACYISAYRFDFVVTWQGTAQNRIFVDAEGSYVTR